MAKTIWKYTLERDCKLDIPKGAQVLSVGEQSNRLRLWALVDTEAQNVERHFKVYGTGDEFPSDEEMKYIGTALLSYGTLVVHVFEV